MASRSHPSRLAAQAGREVARLAGMLRSARAVAVDRGGRPPILVVTTLRESGAAGVNTHIGETVRLLREQDGPVHVVSLDSWTSFVTPLLLGPSYVIRRLGLRRGIALERLLVRTAVELSVRRWVRGQRPAAVYAQGPLAADAALRARGEAPVPVVLVVHFNDSEADELVAARGVEAGSPTERRIRAFETRLLPQVDGLVFVSEYMRRHLAATVPGIDAVPSVIVPNFLEDVVAEPTTPRRDLISVGYLTERKNHGFLLRVLAAARDAGHPYTLTLVGDGPQRAALERLALELGVADLVTFAGARFDVDGLLRQHRLYVHSAVLENCPFALLEAFRAGLAVLVPAVGGIPEVVGSDGAARFWDLDDPGAAARTLTDFLADQAALASAGRAARERFRQEFEAEVVGPRLLGFLTSATRRSSR